MIRELKAAGWVLDRVRGSHHVFRHRKGPGIVVVAHPKKDLGKSLVAAIRRQAGLCVWGEVRRKVEREHALSDGDRGGR